MFDQVPNSSLLPGANCTTKYEHIFVNISKCKGSHGGVLLKKLFLKIWQPLFNKVVGLKACNSIKKRHRQGCFLANIAKFFKNAYFEKHLGMVATLNVHLVGYAVVLKILKTE